MVCHRGLSLANRKRKGSQSQLTRDLWWNWGKKCNLIQDWRITRAPPAIPADLSPDWRMTPLAPPSDSVGCGYHKPPYFKEGIHSDKLKRAQWLVAKHKLRLSFVQHRMTWLSLPKSDLNQFMCEFAEVRCAIKESSDVSRIAYCNLQTNPSAFTVFVRYMLSPYTDPFFV